LQQKYASFFIPEIGETARRGRKRTYKAKPNPSFRIKDKKDEEKKKTAFAVEGSRCTRPQERPSPPRRTA
jgi:hypothetical protein